MKRLLLMMALSILNLSAGEVNDPSRPGYQIATQMTGLISACVHKIVFSLLEKPTNRHFDPSPQLTAQIKASIALLEKKCGVLLVKDKNTASFAPPFNSELYVTTYLASFYENIPYLPEESKEELERIMISFGMVNSLLKTRLEDSVFTDQEKTAALFIMNILQQRIGHLNSILIFITDNKAEGNG